jgi:hypothetical protein
MRIRAIYAVDEAFRRLPAAKRKLMRAEHLRPLLENFFDWVRQVRAVVAGRNLVTSALTYAFNQERSCCAFSTTAGLRWTTRARSVRSDKSSLGGRPACSTAAMRTRRLPLRSFRSSPPAAFTHSTPNNTLRK